MIQSNKLPTPVSALIHAATLVTAGVYLILRSSPIIEYSPNTLIFVTFVGAITSFFAASTGLFQNDLKRVIAYSTCSQMGYLFICCGLSSYDVALFHLVNHAFFKALLFLAAGAVLHATFDEQDIRKKGGIIGFMPFTYISIFIGSFSLIAIPFITGFYSKDLIIEIAYGQYQFSGYIGYWFGSISAGFTAFYSFRLINMTFLNYPNASKSTYNYIHEASIITMVPLLILSIFAIYFGYITKDIFIGIGSDFFNNSLYTLNTNNNIIEAECIPIVFKMFPIVMTFSGSIIAFYLYYNKSFIFYNISQNYIGYRLYRFFNGRYYFDIVINHYIIISNLKIGYTISKVIDKGIIEIIGPNGLSNNILNTSQIMSRMDTGYLTYYSMYIVMTIIVTIIVLSYNLFDYRIIFIIFISYVVSNTIRFPIISYTIISLSCQIISMYVIL